MISKVFIPLDIKKMEKPKFTISRQELDDALKTKIILDDRSFSLKEEFCKIKNMKDLERISGEFALDLEFVKFLFLEFAKI